MSCLWNTIRHQGRGFIAALVCCFLLCAPYISNVLGSAEYTRQWMLWRFKDTLLLVGMIALPAILSVLARSALCRLNRPFAVRLFDHAFLFALGAGLLANLAFLTYREEGYHIGRSGIEMSTCWILLGILIGFSLARPGHQIVLRGKQLCMILAPVMAIVVVQLLFASTYPGTQDPIPPTTAGSAASRGQARVGGSPVFLFVLDEWSYERTCPDGAVRADMPNLAGFARQAVTFHAAESCGEETRTSIPRMLFETDMPVVYGQGQVGFENNGQFMLSRNLSSVFKHYSADGYRTFLIGFGIPFRQLLDGQVHVCRPYPLSQVRPGFLNEAGAHGLRVIGYWTDPWSRELCERIAPGKEYLQKVHLYEDMKRDVFEVMTRQSGSIFAVFHYRLPHHPYLLDANGAFVGQDEVIHEAKRVDGYERNLLALDHFIGETKDALTGAGRFDDAMIILTSDHSYRADPRRANGQSRDPVTHVPLIVKLPNQRRPLSVTAPYKMNRISALIDCGLASDGDPEKIAQLVGSAPSLATREPKGPTPLKPG